MPNGVSDISTASDFLNAPGEMAGLIRSFDWASTSLGPVEHWPQSLKTATSIVVYSPVPMVMLWGHDGVMIYNDAYSVFAAGRHPKSLGSKVREAWPEVAAFNDNVIKIGLAGETLAYKDQELTLFRRGRPEQVWMNLDYLPVIGEDGEPAGVIAIVVETTERVLADRRAAVEQERQRQLFSQMPGFVAVVTGPEHVFEYVNDAYVQLGGVRNYVGRTVREVFPELEGQGFHELLDQVYASGQRYVADGLVVELTGKDGLSYVDLLYEPIRDERGAVTGIFVGGYDITERVRGEAYRDALVRITDRIGEAHEPADIGYAAAEIIGETLRVSRVGYGAIDQDKETLHVDRDWTAPGVETLAGLTPLRDYGAFIDDMKHGDFVSIDDIDLDPRTTAADALKSRSAFSFVNVPVLEHGRLVAVLFVNHGAVRNWSNDELTFIKEAAARTRSAMERSRSETALRDLNADLERQVAERARERSITWQVSPDLLCVLNGEGQFESVNPAWRTVLGWPEKEILNAAFSDFLHPDDLERSHAAFAEAMDGHPVLRFENRYRRKDGEYRWLSWVAIPDSGKIYCSARDVTEEKGAQAELAQAQEALRQSQKMEAVGQLTGGIAHDFNNLLAGISGSLELLETRIAQGRLAGVERYINAAQSSAQRAAALTQRLLAFSRRQTLDPKPTDVNRLIAGVEDLVRRTVGPGVALEVVGAGGLWLTAIDPSQLENALLNLCINARDAMPHGGRITIETANKWLDDRAAKERELPPGQYVSLCVTDTGSGMTPDVVSKAFDPFFTTKPLGQGTGLGLSMIHGFVRQSGGQVRIYSEIGEGTTMCLYFPRFTGASAPAEAPEATHAADPGHGETVLIIDDEPTVRMLMVEVLEQSGYVTIEAVDGPSGLKVLQSDKRIDLLVTDVGLPGGMNGRQVADAARATRPDLRVLFVTGYAENAAVGNGLLDPGMQVITKPFSMAALGNKVREMIES